MITYKVLVLNCIYVSSFCIRTLISQIFAPNCTHLQSWCTVGCNLLCFDKKKLLFWVVSEFCLLISIESFYILFSPQKKIFLYSLAEFNFSGMDFPKRFNGREWKITKQHAWYHMMSCTTLLSSDFRLHVTWTGLDNILGLVAHLACEQLGSLRNANKLSKDWFFFILNFIY